MTSAHTSPPNNTADLHDRDGAATDISTPWVLTAGAGAGKTQTLIRRLRAALNHGVPEGQRLVAITFTERAARDLVHKMRAELGDTAPPEQLFVGTIHAFCLSLLRRFPLEAGLPPVFRAESEVIARVDAAARARSIRWAFFEAVRAAADAGDPAPRDAVQAMVACGAMAHFDLLVTAIERDWDRFRTAALPDPGPWRSALIQLDQVIELTHHADLPNTFRAVLEERLPTIHRARQATTLAAAAMAMFGEGEIKPGTSAKYRPIFVGAWGAASHAVGHAVLATVLPLLVPIVIDAALDRQRSGAISFDDILVLTRQLLERHPAVRAQLRDEFAHLCVDEFQDTDPVQYDIVRLLTDPAGAVDVDDPLASSTRAPVLFAVGDPKQSIYSFRNADVGLFQDLLGAAHVHRGSLSVNFRSRPLILRWINDVFDRWFSADQGVPGGAGQVPFDPLHAEIAEGPANVRVLGGPPAGSSAEAAAQQSADLAAAILAAHGQWQVRADAGLRPARFGDIAVLVRRRADMAALEPVLVAAGIPYVVEGGTLRYETAEVRDLLRVLRAINDPSSAQVVIAALRTSVLAVSDIELVAHRADATSVWDPLDTVAGGAPAVLQAFAVLRRWVYLRPFTSPPDLLATIAREMFSWAASATDTSTQRAAWRRLRTVIDEARDWFEQSGGSLTDYLAFVDGMVEEDERRNVTTDELDDDAVRILTVHAAKGLDFPVVMVAGLGFNRPAADHTRATFAGTAVEVKMGKYLATSGFTSDGDATAARYEAARLVYVACTRARDHLVVCVHRGKSSHNCVAKELGQHLDGAEADREWLVPLADAPPPPVADLLPATTARVPRRAPWTVRSSIAATQVEPLPEGDAAVAVGPPPAPTDSTDPSDPTHPTDRTDPDSAPAPLAGEVALDEPHRGDRSMAADSVHSKPARSAAALPEQAGRYGTVIGRAVHGVVQHVDLQAPQRGLAELVALHCAAEAVPGELHGYVAALVDSVLAGEAFVRMQVAARHGTVRREMYVGGQIGDGANAKGIYGIIDAIWNSPAGFVVVDFKTDHRVESDDVLRRRYTPQLQSYATALTAATGLPVAELVLSVAVAGGAPAVTVSIPLPASQG